MRVISGGWRSSTVAAVRSNVDVSQTAQLANYMGWSSKAQPKEKLGPMRIKRRPNKN